MKKLVFFCILLLGAHISEPLHANDIEFLQDTNLLDTNKTTLVAFSHSRFTETLDVLNYTDNFAETKLKSSTTKTISITHRFDFSKSKIGLDNGLTFSELSFSGYDGGVLVHYGEERGCLI